MGGVRNINRIKTVTIRPLGQMESIVKRERGGGKYLPLLYNFSLCCTDVMAPSTDNLLTRLLILEAVPNSSANIFATRAIWSLGGMMSEIMLVPFLEINKNAN